MEYFSPGEILTNPFFVAAGLLGMAYLSLFNSNFARLTETQKEKYMESSKSSKLLFLVIVGILALIFLTNELILCALVIALVLLQIYLESRNIRILNALNISKKFKSTELKLRALPFLSAVFLYIGFLCYPVLKGI